MSQIYLRGEAVIPPPGPDLFLTGNDGIHVPPDGGGNINIVAAVGSGTINGDIATHTLTYSLPTTVAESFVTNAGTAVPALGVLDILGTGAATTSGAGNTVTINVPVLPATQVFFSAFKSSVTANATGDGTAVTVVFDTAVSNVGGAYNPANGIFTAPATGLFAFYAGVTTDNYGPLHSTYAQTFFGSAEIINADVVNPAGMFVPGVGLITQNTSTIISMTAGDLLVVQITASGSTKTVGVYGQALPGYTTWFRGYQIA